MSCRCISSLPEAELDQCGRAAIGRYAAEGAQGLTMIAMHQRLLSLQLDEMEMPGWVSEGLVGLTDQHEIDPDTHCICLSQVIASLANRRISRLVADPCQRVVICSMWDGQCLRS